ncbi:putative F-box protein PP2-B12 [Chenopodium quinoa]|uniref:F-box domain-containing protein n=1 Tax=Chenopodium quinoa TaxID=63459 RepID=A0A803KNQ7_CHEQI|nr:putative F-box protein PP2-B12 [Chenopodium quinoa]
MEEERELKMVEGGEIFYGLDFYVLPEGCIAAVVSYTSPRDACRFSSISRIFKSASDSDAVWENFLPSDYRLILSRSDGALSLSKKQLFMHLADNPLLIDDGALSFSIEKSTGKKSYIISAKNLSIVWADTPRYWTWHSDPKSRFSEVAELVTVCWLEIKGKIETSLLSPNTDYVAYLVFRMERDAYGFYSPAEVTLLTAEGKPVTEKFYWESQERYQIVPRRVGIFNQFRAPMSRTQSTTQGEVDQAKLPKQRSDGWHEIKIGEFSTGRDDNEEVEMEVLDVKGGNWKGGLVVEGIEIRPKIAME